MISWYIWRLRLFEHENTRLTPLSYKKRSEFSLMSSMLHFALSSVASMGFMAKALMSGAVIYGFMLTVSVVILAVAFCGYTGCYYSGEGEIPWYLRPCIRQRHSRIGRVYSAVMSSNSSKSRSERYAKAWWSRESGSSRASSQHPDEGQQTKRATV